MFKQNYMDFNHDKDNYFVLKKIDDRIHNYVQLHEGNCAANNFGSTIIFILFSNLLSWVHM